MSYELMIAAAKLMPEEDILQELSKALENYKVFRTKESKDKFTMFLMLSVTRYTTDDESLSDTLKKFAEAKQVNNLFKNKEQ